MKIMLTGGGTGGHFYPLIAIAERINLLAKQRKILKVELYYMSNKKYDEQALEENKITFVRVSTGKLRLYFSFKNFIDIVKVCIGVMQALLKMLVIYPDVVISKGGHGSFPALFASKLLKIPVIIHESDTYPGRVNLWSGKFAHRILVSYEETKNFFNKEKTSVVGVPIRNNLMHLPKPESGAEYYNLDIHKPTIFIYPGSLGAEKINNLVLDVLPELLKNYQVIHQCGAKNFIEVNKRVEIILENHLYKKNYILKPFLNSFETRNAAAMSSLIISRGGSTLFEIANWHIPAIVIPITNSNGNHQYKNAKHFSEIGAGILLEENNALANIFLFEVNNILMYKDTWQKMHQATLDIVQIDAAMEIATEAILIGEFHELE